jgi:uncharacterized protein with von Willebrand factor type A (vWA) domain
MPEPVTTLTASAIATLAFQEFIKLGAGELAKKFTAEAIAKMGQLRELIWNRLREKDPAAEQALKQAQAGEQQGMDKVAELLGVEMLDQEFAGQVKAIAQEIAKIIEDNSNVNQMSYGDKSPNLSAKSESGV